MNILNLILIKFEQFRDVVYSENVIMTIKIEFEIITENNIERIRLAELRRKTLDWQCALCSSD